MQDLQEVDKGVYFLGKSPPSFENNFFPPEVSCIKGLFLAELWEINDV